MDATQAERDKYPMRAITNKQMAFGAGSVVAALLTIQPFINMFTTREANDARLTSIEKTIEQKDVLAETRAKLTNERLDRMAQAMKERDTAMESRYNREADHMINRIEVLEAARMGVSPKSKITN